MTVLSDLKGLDIGEGCNILNFVGNLIIELL